MIDVLAFAVPARVLLRAFLFLMLSLEGISLAAAEVDQATLARLNQAIADDRGVNALDGAPIEDELLVRRLYLTLAGRIPTVAEQQRLQQTGMSSVATGKLVEDLLNGPGWVHVRGQWWEDQLRVTSVLTRRTSGEPYRQWIRQVVEDGWSYRRIVQELLGSSGPAFAEGNGATGYYIRDRGMPLDNMANTMQVFLGSSIACAQCHDHPYNDWTQKQFYELAAYTHDASQYAKPSLPTGKEHRSQRKLWARTMREATPQQKNTMRRLATVAYLNVPYSTEKQLKLPHDYRYDDAAPLSVVAPAVPFGGTPDMSIESKRQRFAAWVTGAENPYFSAVAVNELWAMAFGEGLVEPRHDWHAATQPSMPKTLQVLQDIFVGSGYQSRAVMAALVQTDLFAAQATAPGSSWDGPRQRRLSAEQVWDSLVVLNTDDPDQRPKYQPAEKVLQLYQALGALDPQGLTRLAQDVIQRQTLAKQMRQEIKQIAKQAQAAKKAGDATKAKKLTQLVKQKRKTMVTMTEYADAGSQADEIIGMLRVGGARRYLAKVPTLRALYLPAPAPPEHFLRTFGQSDRVIPAGSHQQATVPQALLLMNGLADQVLSRRGSPLMNGIREAKDPVTYAYQAILARAPSAEEYQSAQQLYGEYGAADVVWALVNTHEFIFWF